MWIRRLDCKDQIEGVGIFGGDVALLYWFGLD